MRQLIYLFLSVVMDDFELFLNKIVTMSRFTMLNFADELINKPQCYQSNLINYANSKV